MKKFLCLTVVIAFSTGLAVAQSPSPAESPAASPAAKHKHSAKKEASPAAGESPSESPAAKKKHSKKEASPAPNESPAASPMAEKKAKRSKKEKTAATTEASGAAAAGATTAASPAKKKSWFEKMTEGPSASNASKTETAGPPAPGGGPGMVWVNTDTKVYHKEGSRWYGRTKKGQYMKESDAIKAGYRGEKEREPAKEKEDSKKKE